MSIIPLHVLEYLFACNVAHSYDENYSRVSQEYHRKIAAQRYMQLKAQGINPKIDNALLVRLLIDGYFKETSYDD